MRSMPGPISNRPLLLDLFCKAGGAAMGYYRAGFDVVGVDIEPQPRYPFTFVRADALRPPFDLSKFDAIHASPPCQAYTPLRMMPNVTAFHPDLVAVTRDLLVASDKPWVIENVPGSPLKAHVRLCGTMFGLRTPCGAELRRHRLFETNFALGLVPPCQHYADRPIGVYGGRGRDRASDHQKRTIGVFGDHARDSAVSKRKQAISVVGHAPYNADRRKSKTAGIYSNFSGREGFTTDAARIAMGIDWMVGSELSQAIPPAYTEFIGRQLLEHINAQ